MVTIRRRSPAASAAEAAFLPPALTSPARACGERLKPGASTPALRRSRLMGPPMTPGPINPTGMSGLSFLMAMSSRGVPVPGTVWEPGFVLPGRRSHVPSFVGFGQQAADGPDLPGRGGGNRPGEGRTGGGGPRPGSGTL